MIRRQFNSGFDNDFGFMVVYDSSIGKFYKVNMYNPTKSQQEFLERVKSISYFIVVGIIIVTYQS